MSRIWNRRLHSVLACTLCVLSCLPAPAQVAVRNAEGLLHGFLVLRSQQGEILAHGELFQKSRGTRVTAHLVFHFKDGSLYDETAVYSESREFRLIRYSLVTKGPSFPHPQSVSIDVPSGNVVVKYSGDDGKEQSRSEHMKLPPDLANGMISLLTKNIPPGEAPLNASMLVATPKPRLVRLTMSQQGEDTFHFGGEKRKANHYVVKIELKGLTGVIAELIGKQPPDIHAWILGGVAPAFLKSSGPLYAGGPIWQIELASPTWPAAAEEKPGGATR